MKFLRSISYVLLGACALCSCSSEIGDVDQDNNKSHLRTTRSNQEMILAAHKCNEVQKVRDAADYGIESFEVDIHVAIENGIPQLMIGHELETTTGQTFADYMDDLMSIKPDFKFLWLDFKDLDSTENETIIRATLDSLDREHSIKHRVLVESRYITYLTSFANDGWNVSYYSAWSSLEGKTAEQQRAICEGWLQLMRDNNVDGISFDARVYQAIKNNFEGKEVNGRIVKQNSWNYNISYRDTNLEEQLRKYSHLTVLLIGFPNDEVPKLITDVEFAENGVATNFGELLESLPASGSINSIETQYNFAYNKYEAIFDGTNFFYIPYAKNDAIGSAIGGKFSMELLFTPNGGVNPFSSMESGGLGYELTSSNELAFYYNANNRWVLPNNKFQTKVQLGQDIYYHVVVTYDKSVCKMYVNGSKVKEERVTGTFTYPKKDQSPDYLFGIGGDYRDTPTPTIQNSFRGRIVHAKIYKGVLNDLEVQEISSMGN